MAEKRTEYGEVINKKVIGQLHNSPKHSFTVQDVAGGGSGSSFDIKGLLERTITEAVIPEDITSIGNNAFSGCSSLASIEAPNVTSIGNGSFNGCDSLTSIKLPSITSIGSGTFSGIRSLTSIELPNVTSIGIGAFSGCPLTSIDLPNVTSIGGSAFYNCSSLTYAELHNVTSIEMGAFSGCTRLIRVIINSVNPPEIGDNVFLNCHADLKIYVPASAVDTYKAASGWSDYADRVEAIQE